MAPVQNGVTHKRQAHHIRSWDEVQAPNLLKLIHEGRFCDVTLVVGPEKEKIPAVRALLAVASDSLASRLERLSPGDHFALPEATIASVRALIAWCCGVDGEVAFRGCSQVELQVAARALGIALDRCELVGASQSQCLTKETRKDVVQDLSELNEGLRLSVVSLVAGTLLFLVALSAFLPTVWFNLLQGGFFMDDQMIRRNEMVVSETLDWGRLWRTDYWGLEMFDPNGGWTHKSFRPLAVLTFRWNYLMHGFDSCGWHVSNVFMHATASGLVGLVGHQALRLPASWCFMFAALFAVHPVHTENILYIVGRADILCCHLLALAFILYAPVVGSPNSRPPECFAWGLPRVIAVCAVIVASGLCKETGFTYFGLPVVWEILAWLRPVPKRNLPRAIRVILLLVIGSAACCWRMWYTGGTGIARMDPYSNPIAAAEGTSTKVFSYLFVHGMYIKILLWPFFLCYDYSMDAVPLVQSSTDVRLLLPAAVYLGFFQVLCLGVAGLRKPGGRVLTEGLWLMTALFVLSFLPMSNIFFPVGTLIGERLLYLPSIAVLGGLMALACSFSGGRSSQSGKGYRSSAAWLGLLGLGSVWWWLCYQRVLEWKDAETITIIDGLRQLRSSRTQFNLANIYLKDQRYDEALSAYRRAIATDPQERDAQPLYHAGQILLYKGQHQEAERYLHKAVTGYFSPLTMHEEEVWHDYGLALWHTGRAAESVHNFQNAIITNPQFAKGYNNLACALVLAGLSMNPPDQQSVQQGLQIMEQAVALQPQMLLYWRNAAALLSLVGDAQAAAGAWQQLLKLDPASAGQPIPRDCVWEFYFR